MQVRIAFGLNAIQELDSSAQKLSVAGVPLVTWRDEFLTWDKTQFGGLRSINVFQNEIWRPNIFLGHAVGDMSEIGISSLILKVEDTGLVFWAPAGHFTFSCTVDIRFYPFDTQDCFLDFVIGGGLSVDEVTLINVLPHVHLESFTENVEWQLLEAKSSTQRMKMHELDGQVFRNALKLKRRILFVVIHSVAPLILLSSINILVFALPAESGEKVSLSITLFLAFAIFLTMLSESLPKNSLTLPIFSVYLITVNVLSTLYVILTVVVLKIYHLPSERPVPALLQWCIARNLCSLRQACHRKVGHLDDDSGIESVSKVNEHAREYENNEKLKTPDSSCQVTWQDVSKWLDKVFLWIFLVMTVVSSIVFAALIFLGS